MAKCAGRTRKSTSDIWHPIHVSRIDARNEVRPLERSHVNLRLVGLDEESPEMVEQHDVLRVDRRL